MPKELITVEIDVTDERFIKTLERAGVQMPVQCNQGFCGTCVCKANPSQFEEEEDQIGNFEPDENILPCAVRAKRGLDKVIVELPAHLVPSHLAKMNEISITP